MKFSTFAAAAEGQDVTAFQEWFLGDYAQEFARDAFGLVASVVRLSQDPPSGSAPRVVDADGEPSLLPYHAIMESWFVTAEDFRRAARRAEPRLRERGVRFVSYRTTPLLEKDPRFAEAGSDGARPGMTLITPVNWLPKIAREEARRHWDEHVSTALRVHVGLTKYERNWVDEVMSWSVGAKPFDAYADFSFRTPQDFVNNFFPGSDDILEIGQDIENFISGGTALCFNDPQRIFG